MPSWFARRVISASGPAAGSPAAAIQEHYLGAIRAGERRDAQAQLAEYNAMVDSARAAGYLEVVAAMTRYGLSICEDPMEPPELAVKAVTLAIHALPFRPQSDTVEGRLLNAWAEWDIATRNASPQSGEAMEAFAVAVREARDPKVIAALILLDQACNAQAFYKAFGAVGLKVYQAAYHRDPPSKEAFGF
jgi:hypothetical protein